MLPKKNRASQKIIRSVFKGGKNISSTNLAFKFLPAPKNETKISFIAPKAVARLATGRNALRRLGYSILKKNQKDLPVGIAGAFIFKKSQKDATILENEIKEIFNKIN